MCKSLDYWVSKDKIIQTDLALRTKQINLKGKGMLGFIGSFKTNFILPEYIGLGKSVSRGFGVVCLSENSTGGDVVGRSG